MRIRTIKLQYVIYTLDDATDSLERIEAVAQTEEEANKFVNYWVDDTERAKVLWVNSDDAFCPECQAAFRPKHYSTKCPWCYVKENGRKCRNCEVKFIPKEKYHFLCDDCQHVVDISGEEV